MLAKPIWPGEKLNVRFTRTWPQSHFPCIYLGSTLQRIEFGGRPLFHFADIACVKAKSRTEHRFFQIQMKMCCQTCEHPEAGVIVKLANNPLALIQNLIG